MHVLRRYFIAFFLSIFLVSCTLSVSARYYNPAIGRFTQPDTEIPDPYNPQSLNRYSYAYNNPLTYIDPTGHEPVKAEYGTKDKVSKTVEDVIQQVIKDNPDATSTEVYRKMVEYYGSGQYRIDGVPRYVYTENSGPIDLMHYFRAAMESHTYDVFTHAGGYIVEFNQLGMGSGSSGDPLQSGNAAESFFSIEDIPSNTVGISAGLATKGLSADAAKVEFDRQMAELKCGEPQDDPNYNRYGTVEVTSYGERSFKVPWPFPFKAPDWWM